jgi:hypothetical protein
MTRTPSGIERPEGGIMSSIGTSAQNFWTGARRAAGFYQEGEARRTTAERNTAWWASLGGALAFGFMFGGGDIATFLIAAIIGALVMPMIVGGAIGVADGFALRGDGRARGPEQRGEVRQRNRELTQGPEQQPEFQVGSVTQDQARQMAAASGVSGDQRFTVSDAAGVQGPATSGLPVTPKDSPAPAVLPG